MATALDLARHFARSRLGRLTGMYAVSVAAHYGAAHLYTRYCVPLSVEGFVASAFYTITPHCSALRWCVYRGAESISGMWTVGAAWVIAQSGAS